jgi:hypothetical protein
MAGSAIRLNKDAENTKPLELSLARFLGVCRVDLGDDGRITRPFAAVIETAASSAGPLGFRTGANNSACLRIGRGVALIWVVVEADAQAQDKTP